RRRSSASRSSRSTRAAGAGSADGAHARGTQLVAAGTPGPPPADRSRATPGGGGADQSPLRPDAGPRALALAGHAEAPRRSEGPAAHHGLLPARDEGAVRPAARAPARPQPPGRVRALRPRPLPRSGTDSRRHAVRAGVDRIRRPTDGHAGPARGGVF